MSGVHRSVSTAAQAASPSPFATASTDAAAYLISVHGLHYRGARRGAGNGHSVEFLIDDPDRKAEQLARDFRLGAPDPVDPRALLQVHSFLRSEVARIRAEMANVQPVRL